MASKRPKNVEEIIEEAKQWCQDFESPDQKIGRQALEYAWRKYDQIQSNKAAISGKDDALLRTSATLMMAEVGALKLLQVEAYCWFFLSLASLTLTVVLLVWSRRTTVQQNLPTIEAMLNGMDASPNPQVYLAKCLHPVVASATPHAYQRMRINNWATLFFCLAVMMVIPFAWQAAKQSVPRQGLKSTPSKGVYYLSPASQAVGPIGGACGLGSG